MVNAQSRSDCPVNGECPAQVLGLAGIVEGARMGVDDFVT
jgi:hypothetical protein